MHWNGDWDMGWVGFWWLLIIAAVALVVWLARSAARRKGNAQDSPEEVLMRRYANGEMDHGTYEQKLEDLRR